MPPESERVNGTWQTVEIGGKPADVYVPPLTAGGRPRFGVLFLHPLGQETLVGDVAFTSLFDEHRLACVAPHAGRSWWVSRVCPDFDPVLTPERHLLDHVLPYFQSTW